MAEGGGRCGSGKETQVLRARLNHKMEEGMGKPNSGSPEQQEQVSPFSGGSLGHCGSLSHTHGHPGVGQLPFPFPSGAFWDGGVSENQRRYGNQAGWSGPGALGGSEGERRGSGRRQGCAAGRGPGSPGRSWGNTGRLSRRYTPSSRVSVHACELAQGARAGVSASTRVVCTLAWVLGPVPGPLRPAPLPAAGSSSRHSRPAPFLAPFLAPSSPAAPQSPPPPSLRPRAARAGHLLEAQGQVRGLDRPGERG